MTENKKDPTKKLFVITKILSAAVIMLCFIVMFVIGVFFPRVSESNYDKDLAKFPEFTFESFFSGEFASGITKWYSDTIFGRDGYKDTAAVIESLRGPEKDEELIGDFDFSEDEESEESYGDTSSSAEISEQVSEMSGLESDDQSSDDPSVFSDDEQSSTSIDTSSSEESASENNDGELINSIYIDSSNRAMEIYTYGSSGGKRYAEYMNAFYADLKEKVPDANLYSMFIPKQCGIYLWDSTNSKVKGKAGETEKAINAIEPMLDPGIISVNVYNTLLAHKSEPIYFRTDHHWTALGAYYATVELCKSAGVSYMELSEYTKEVRSNYLGTMYKYTDYSTKLLNNKEDFETYKPTGKSYTATYYNQSVSNSGIVHDIFWHIGDDKVSSWYMTFICGDGYAVNIKSNECSNGRKLMIIKDSYGDAMAPYFLESFEEVWIIDLRYFELNAIDFAAEHGITDICFSLCSYSVTGSLNKNIERLRTIK